MTTGKVTKYARNTNGIAQNLLKYFNKENTILSDSENTKAYGCYTHCTHQELHSFVHGDASNYSVL